MHANLYNVQEGSCSVHVLQPHGYSKKSSCTNNAAIHILLCTS